MSGLDSGMQVTIAFNHFGQKLIQRMPRCRRGYIHVVNNDFTRWEMYAIGGSGNPTINSQGNRYTAPIDRNAKEITKRVDTSEGSWRNWNWRSEWDIMVNGAYFISSGEEVEAEYEKAYIVEPKSANFIDQLTMNAGVFGSRRHNSGRWSAGNTSEGYDDLDDYDEVWQVVCFEVLAFRFLTSKHWSEDLYLFDLLESLLLLNFVARCLSSTVTCLFSSLYGFWLFILLVRFIFCFVMAK